MLTEAEERLFKTLRYVHNSSLCEGRLCPVHRPSNHHMRSWTPHWRDDRGILERICTHGVGHPDPDQFDYWAQTGQDSQAVHACDGCCFQNIEGP